MAVESIKIRIIPKGDLKHKSEDDIITVSRTYCNGVYKMVYKDATQPNGFQTTTTRKEFLKYLETLFTMLARDEVNNENVQVFFPQFPTMIISRDDFDDEEVLAAVKSAARATFRAWHMNSIHEMWNYEE